MDQNQYIEFKKQVAGGLQSSANQFDKAILTLSAGALALSLTFIKDLEPHPDVTTIKLLAYSWILFISSICLTLLSFNTSIWAYKRFDKIIDILQQDPTVDRTTLKNLWNWVTIILNILSLVTFITGTILMTYSVYHNLTT